MPRERSVPDQHELSDDQLVERFAGVSQWRRGDERAPHKPLLLLYALARLQRGEARLIPFSSIEPDLGNLLRDFGPPRNTRPEYPFWHLQSDELWDIPQRAVLQANIDEADHRHNPQITVIRAVDAHGGLPEALYDRLRSRPALVNRIVQELLVKNWEPSYHQAILDAVAMPWVQTTRAPRDPAFRDTILRIYSHRCAVCGWDGQLANSDLALEAAHLYWHSHGGPDTPDNGVALCCFHHTALDRGALGLDDHRHILVSQHLRGSSRLDDYLLRFAGQPLTPPQPGESPPALDYIHWHLREVFRGPARQAT